MLPIVYTTGDFELDLESHEVTDDDILSVVIPFLEKNPSIILLNLSHNSIKWYGAKALAENITRKIDINLSDNFIHDIGAYFLSKNNYIERLAIRNNNLTPLAYNVFLINPFILSIDMREQNDLSLSPEEQLTAYKGALYVRGPKFPLIEEFSAEGFKALADMTAFSILKRKADVSNDCSSLMARPTPMMDLSDKLPRSDVRSSSHTDRRLSYTFDGISSSFFNEGLRPRTPTNPPLKSRAMSTLY
jgi:hypothetical protein